MSTREITDVLRDMARAHTRTDTQAGVTSYVYLSRSYRRRRYFLCFQGEHFVSVPIMYDATNKVLHVRPQSHYRAPDTYGPHFTSERMAKFAAETLYLDALMDLAPSLAHYSETPETLTLWRNSRTN